MSFRHVLGLAGCLALSADAQVASPAPSPAPGLSDLEARAPKPNADFDLVAQFMDEVARLVQSGALKTGDEFYRAARLAGPSEEFRMARVHYELLLAAIAASNSQAEASLPNAWDGLLRSLGRPMRFDDGKRAAKSPDSFTLEPAPKAIQDAWVDPTAARAAAKSAKDNAEMQTIVDADQANRPKDWSKLTEAERQAQSDGDHERKRRTREIVAAGALHTARDFANAALVMQHSGNFADLELAHELAVCSLLLGDRSFGRQMVALTYDRMLHSVGHDQRFGTQSVNGRLLRLDETGICDAERLALGRQSLARPSSPSPK